MTEVKLGDLDKLGILYERYKDRLYRYFYRVTCGDQGYSEDLVQQVFIRIIKYKNSFRGEGNFGAWIFRIAHHVAIDYHREVQYMDDEYRLENHMGVTRDPAQRYEEQEQVELLNKALDKLRFDDREVLILSKIDGLKHKEVAQIVGSTEGAVRVKVHRALQELKKVYFNEENSRS